MSVRVISDAEFESVVLQAEQPVLVYFWADWCGPCRLMSPVLEKLAAAQGDRLTVVKMEVDPNPTSVARCKVEGVPAFRLFRAGEALGAWEGALPPAKLESLITPYLAA